MVQSLITTAWCGLNNPLIGQFMDRRPFSDETYRWFMRISNMIGQFLTFIFMFDFGLTSVQRVTIFGIAHGVNNVFWTMAEIGEQKYIAGLTPISQERAKLNVWQHTFHKLAYPIANLPWFMQGFMRDRYHWTDQRIFIQGFAMLFPFALAGGVIHTFARNRVTFDHTKNAAHASERKKEEPKEKLTMREAFSVLKHNKYVLYWLIANFFNQFIPEFDSWMVWRFLVPSIRLPLIGEVNGPGIPALFGQFTGLPITFLVPFMRQIIDRLGGPKRTLVFGSAGSFVVRLSQYFIGYHSRGRIIGHFALDTFRETMDPIGGLADHILGYEMLDYVEYKTGVRSEGVNRAIVGFVEKLVKENIATVAGNYFQYWARVHEIDGNVPNPVVPERFARWAWPVWILGGALRSVFLFIARASFPYKVGQNVHIEAELKARRELAEQTQKELEEELETAGKV